MTPEEQPLPELPADLLRTIAAPGKDASTELSKHRTQLSEKRTGMSTHRTGLSSLRSHLSNERTHLSYLRTSISLIGFGITLNRFSIFLQEKRDVAEQTSRLRLRSTENVGAGMVGIGLVLLVWSLYRYWRVSREIERHQYDPRNRMVLMLTLGILLCGGLSAVWLFLLSGGR
jgi:putative membrane protein